MAGSGYGSAVLVKRKRARGARAQSEQELILRAQRYEAEALAELFDAHFDAVYHYLSVLVGDRVETEELARQVFLRALEGLPRFRRFDAGFGPWLERIANTVLSEAGRAGGVGAGASSGHLPREAQLRAAIRDLTPDQRDVLGLRLVAGIPADDVSRATGRGMSRVQALQHRALLALRHALNPEPPAGTEEVG
jgi:DNA-directed RNA polymerase specialized sigma24 family protein